MSLLEIGGYMAFDGLRQHNRATGFALLNSARSCLKAAVKTLAVREIQVPYYSCPAVWNALLECDCKILPYELDGSFQPLNTNPDLPLLYINYYGVCGRQMEAVLTAHKNVLADNAQAYYAQPSGMAAIYSPRKFFAMPDGGLLWPAQLAPEKLENEQAWDRCGHLLKRADQGAQAGYGDFRANEEFIAKHPVRRMSKLSAALWSNADSAWAAHQRLTNYHILHDALKAFNGLKLDPAPGDVPLAYPFHSGNGTLRQKLLEHGIYVPKYWPRDGRTECMSGWQATNLAESILPLPIDQRYGDADMRRILDVVHG